MKLVTILAMLMLSFSAFAKSKVQVFSVTGMTCVSCATSVEKELKKIPKIDSVDISLRNATVTIQPKDGKVVDKNTVYSAIEKAGFKATLSTEKK